MSTEPIHGWWDDHRNLALTAEFMARQQDDMHANDVLANIIYMLEKPWKHNDDYNLAQAESEIRE